MPVDSCLHNEKSVSEKGEVRGMRYRSKLKWERTAKIKQRVLTKQVKTANDTIWIKKNLSGLLEIFEVRWKRTQRTLCSPQNGRIRLKAAVRYVGGS